MKAAFGKIIITPPGGAKGKQMAGYSRSHYAQGILDEIMARGVILEDVVAENIKKKFLFISLDLLKIPLMIADYIKEKIKEKANFGLGAGQIMIHATHTHHAPDLTGEFYWPGGADKVIKGILFGGGRNDKYIVWMANQIVKMVKQMIKDLQPAKVAWGKKLIDSDVMINRRHPVWESKQNLGVMTFKNPKTNKLFGIMTTYGMHPTTMSAKNDKMSADYPGRVVYRIEEDTNHEVAAVFFTGAAGDLNPITTCGTDFAHLEKDPAARQSIYAQTGTYEHTKKLGYHLGTQALKLAQSIPDEDYYDTMECQAYVKKFRVPFKDFQPYVYEWGNWIANKAIVFVKKWVLFPIALTIAHANEPNFPGLAIKAPPFSFKKGYHINVYTVIQIVRFKFGKSKKKGEVKELTYFGVPGELFEDIEKNLLKRSPTAPENTIIIQNANDWCGYLFPIKEYITQGGYEPFASTSPLVGKYVEREFYILTKEIEEGAQLGYW